MFLAPELFAVGEGLPSVFLKLLLKISRMAMLRRLRLGYTTAQIPT